GAGADRDARRHAALLPPGVRPARRRRGVGAAQRGLCSRPLTAGPLSEKFEHGFKNLNTRSKNIKAGAKRLEILAGAAEAIRRLGLRGAGMRQIAQACGVTPGNLYYYFRDKHELVYFCQDTTLTSLLAVAREARDLRPAEVQLAWLIGGHLRVTLYERAAGAAHLELDGLPPPL